MSAALYRNGTPCLLVTWIKAIMPLLPTYVEFGVSAVAASPTTSSRSRSFTTKVHDQLLLTLLAPPKRPRHHH